MPVPEQGSIWSMIDAPPNPVLVSDLDLVVLKELMAEKRGFTLLDLRKRSKYSSDTTTSGEFSDEPKSPPLSTLLVVADNHLTKITSAIPPVDPEVLTVCIMKMKATKNVTSLRNSRKRKRSGLRTPVRVNPRAEATILGDSLVRVTLVKDEGPEPPPPPGWRKSTQPTPKGEQPVEKQTVPSNLSARRRKERERQKRKLNWQSKCLRAAWVE